MTILHIIIPLITAFAGAYIAHRFSIGREGRNHKRTLEIIKIQEFNKASAIFRSTFVKELRILKRAENDPIASVVLEKPIVRHEIATTKFRPYLEGERLRRFNIAWQKYACPKFPYKQYPNYVDVFHYHAVEINERKKLRDFAIQNIEELLDIVKPI